MAFFLAGAFFLGEGFAARLAVAFFAVAFLAAFFFGDGLAADLADDFLALTLR